MWAHAPKVTKSNGRVLRLFFPCSSNPLEQLVTRLTPKMSGRMMKYPYTFSAKLAQFPLQHYVKNVWVVKYYIFGVGLSIPVFSWIQKMGKLHQHALMCLCCKDHSVYYTYLIPVSTGIAQYRIGLYS